MSHTPGPWTCERFTTVVNHELRRRIADVAGADAENRAANARLIAAAPELEESNRELLWALEQVLDALGALSNPSELSGYAIAADEATRIYAAIGKANKAIAKAEGWS